MKTKNHDLIIAETKKDRTDLGFSLITVIFAILGLSIIGVSLNTLLATRANASVVDFQSQQAMYAADGVLHYVLRQYFQGDTDFSNNSAPTVAPFSTGSPAPISFGGAQVWVQYSSQTAWNTTVTVTAKVGNSVRQIQQKVTQALPFGKSAFSQGNITISGNALIPLICAPYWSACSGFAAGDFGADGSITNPSHFRFSTWLGGSHTATSNMQVVLPKVTIDSMNSMLLPASETNPPVETTGDVTLGPGVYGSSSAPYRIHTTGNVNIAKNTFIVGNVVSDGNITMNQNVGVSGTLAARGNIQGDVSPSGAVGEGFFARPGPEGEVLPAMIAEGDVTLNTQALGLVIDGMIISGDDLTIQSNATLIGTGQALILSGPILSYGDITIENNRGFSVLGYDSADFSSFIQAGSFRLDNWQEV